MAVETPLYGGKYTGNPTGGSMDEKPGVQEEARPVVNIFMRNADSARSLVHCVCLGLEEEGIPWRCLGVEDIHDINGIAKQAADLSKLNVGLAVDEAGQIIVLHHRDLPRDKPLLTLSHKMASLNADTLRCIGANAARLVKGNPLLLQENGREERPDGEDRDPCMAPAAFQDREAKARSESPGALTAEEEKLVQLIVKAIQAIQAQENRGEV